MSDIQQTNGNDEQAPRMYGHELEVATFDYYNGAFPGTFVGYEPQRINRHKANKVEAARSVKGTVVTTGSIKKRLIVNNGGSVGEPLKKALAVMDVTAALEGVKLWGRLTEELMSKPGKEESFQRKLEIHTDGYHPYDDEGKPLPPEKVEPGSPMPKWYVPGPVLMEYLYQCNVREEREVIGYWVNGRDGDSRYVVNLVLGRRYKKDAPREYAAILFQKKGTKVRILTDGRPDVWNFEGTMVDPSKVSVEEVIALLEGQETNAKSAVRATKWYRRRGEAPVHTIGEIIAVKERDNK